MDIAFTITDAVAAGLATAIRATLDNGGAGLTDRQVIRRATRRYWREIYAAALTNSKIDTANAQIAAAQVLLAQARSTAEQETDTALGPDE